MALLTARAALRARRILRAFGVAGLALVLLERCAPDGPGASRQVAYADNLRVEVIHDSGSPASGEQDSLPEVVYTGRHARLAVTLTDSDYGVPVAGIQVAAKVIATTWVGPKWQLQPRAPQSAVHEGKVEIPTRGPYRIDVEVEVPGGRSTVLLGFDY